MLSVHINFFLQAPDESEQRILHPGTVISVDGELHTATLDQEEVPVEAGQSIHLYYEIQSEFMQQRGRIEAVMRGEPDNVLKKIIGFTTTGEPMSAEERQCYRVSTVTSGMTVRVESDNEYPLIDVSATGLSFTAPHVYHFGQIVKVHLTHDDHNYRGEGHIQSIGVLPNGKTRYGIHCVDDEESNVPFSRGLQQVNIAVQRNHLRRLAETH